ncbi:two-component system chemotaxis response regulator CheB [Oxalobacteraceae bacterium GrIS 1.11]
MTDKTDGKAGAPWPAIVVVGTSAGGLQALTKLVAQLPADFPAPLLIVQHMAADASGELLLRTLGQAGKLACAMAQDGAEIEPGHLYLAPPDHHFMLSEGRMAVLKGARENRWRPAIDPLFRSAAVAYGNRVIGVLLTGYLDDGSAGLVAIQRCGGVCVVQDPADAAYPDMPQNALNQLRPDYCVPLAQMGELLARLVARKLGKRRAVPKDIAIEAVIAARVLGERPSREALGAQADFNCPVCGSPLWHIAGEGETPRYRCYTGHAYTNAVLWAEQTAKIEETLWVALRMFEERRNLLVTMATTQSGAGARSTRDRADQSEVYIERIKAMLVGDPLPGAAAA